MSELQAVNCEIITHLTLLKQQKETTKNSIQQLNKEKSTLTTNIRNLNSKLSTLESTLAAKTNTLTHIEKLISKVEETYEKIIANSANLLEILKREEIKEV